ncbi:hypothetical protein [Paraburkholderia fungorum]|jgi:hypothetical protein|uniref:hypothetical protein n=1 Tax=Paraburkholderia fungorum TaxID=134537 RepID=UPI000D085B37|nr:hypothetical protein [Paraburkholderia fungorum]PRZ45379.1 hypothetical protein BX589_13958 [Paraburkholderia fungorum]
MNDKNYYLNKLDLFPFPAKITDHNQIENRKLTEEELQHAQALFDELLSDELVSPLIGKHARQMILHLTSLPELGAMPNVPLLFLTAYSVRRDLEGIND